MLKVGDLVKRRRKASLFNDLTFHKKVIAVEQAFLKNQNRTIKLIKLEGDLVFTDYSLVVKASPDEIAKSVEILNKIFYIQELEQVDGVDCCVSTNSGQPKLAYANEEEAYKAVFSLMSRDFDTKIERGMVIYTCPSCNNLHIGNRI